MLPAAQPAQTRATAAELTTMPSQRFIASLFTFAVLAVLTACTSGERSTDATLEGAQRIPLTPEQTRVIEGGVKQMVERQDGVSISAVTATRVAQKTGLQVCGYVATNDAAGKRGPDLPFYIELLESSGAPVAERGQVGSDPSRLSKVNFMCRLNR